MSSTPTKSKAVSFKIPASMSTSPGTQHTQAVVKSGIAARRLSPGPKPSSPLSVQGKAQGLKPASPLASQNNTAESAIPTAQHGAQPDLVADIVETKTSTNQSGARSESQQRSGGTATSTPSPVQHRHNSPTAKKHHVGGRLYVRANVRDFANTTSTRDRSPLLDQHKSTSPSMSNTQVAQLAGHVRSTTNSSCHEHIRALKYDAARLREQLLKVEEEIKNMNRGRSTLEIAIQDVRKALSVNQQSISTQQKKSSKGDEVCTVQYNSMYSGIHSQLDQSINAHVITCWCAYAL